MERRVKILFLALVYMMLSGKSCVDESNHLAWQEKQAEMAIDSIRLEFGAGYLSEEARFAAEKSAITKLKDLESYLEIYTDVSLDTLFRVKAGEMICDLFFSEGCRLSFGPMKNDNMKSVTLGEFIEKGFGQDILRAGLVYDSIRVQEPLQKSSEEAYSGKLAAIQTVIIHFSADSIISPAIPVTVDFISSKQVKIIGQDTLKVWEEKLGDLEVVK